MARPSASTCPTAKRICPIAWAKRNANPACFCGCCVIHCRDDSFGSRMDFQSVLRRRTRGPSYGKVLRRKTTEQDDMRHDGRRADELRPLKIKRRYTRTAPGSVLIQAGRTTVLCTASVEEQTPPWMKGQGRGWVTAEYN